MVLHEVPGFPPNYSIDEVVRKFKSLAAWELFKRFLGLGTELWGGEFWTDKYYAATVGESGNWIVAERYVKNQDKNQNNGQLQMF